MKKILSLCLLIAVGFVFAGCDLLFGGNKGDTTVKSSDSYLTVTARNDGLLIQKKHPDSWTSVNIHIVNKSTGHENARIQTNQHTNEFLYPFVENKDVYSIYIEKQETLFIDNEWRDYQAWGETAAVEITSVGGEGNLAVYYKKYSYNPETFELTLKDLTIDKPSISSLDAKFEASLFLAVMWKDPSRYGVKCVQKDSVIDLSSAQDFLQDAKQLSLDLAYKCKYSGISYSCPVLNGRVYRYSEFNTHTNLNGGVELPKVYINPYSGRRDGSTYHFGDNWGDASIRIEDPNGEYSLEETLIKMKDRGNSTKWTGKTPFSIKFSDKTSVLGMKKAKRWVLMANYFDRSLIRTELAGYIGTKVFNSYWNASFTPVNVYVNNRFIGTYDFGECNKIAKERINIQSIEDFADKKFDKFKDVNEDGTVDINDAGFMVEIDTAINWDNSINTGNYKNAVSVNYSGAERIYFYSSEYCIPMTLKEPDFGDYTYSDSDCLKYGKYAKSKIDAFEKMLISDEFETEYEKYIDVTSFADWYLINEFAKNSDANFQKSVPVVYNAATGKLYMGPNWDFDLGFGNFNHSYSTDSGSDTVENPTGWYIHGGRKGCDENKLYCTVNNTKEVQSWWINRLFAAPAFKAAVKERWMEKSEDFKAILETKIIESANKVSDSIPQNEEIIPRLGQYSWNGPSGYGNRTDYEDEVDYLYNWCLERYNWMNSQIQSW